jgi:hypothetical protein
LQKVGRQGKTQKRVLSWSRTECGHDVGILSRNERSM